jgi:site-specific DNA-methyltransferase (adenine-specific)
VIDEIILGDCLDVLKKLPDASVDSICTDPPYGLGTREPTTEEIIAYLQGAELNTGGDFMNKRWRVPSVAIWKECFRVLKPGGHLLSFGGTRTFDLISVGIRAAGFECRDTIAEFGALSWIQGMGFPKSLNISKEIDKRAGAKREVIGTYRVGGNALTSTKEKGGTYVTGAPNSPPGDLEITAPATEEAKKFDGWGTALKPSWEPILVFRKPLQESTIVDNVLKHGTGGLNIDATRVKGVAEKPGSMRSYRRFDDKGDEPDLVEPPEPHAGGRWPPNSVFVHADGCKKIGTKTVSGDNRGNPGGTRPGGFVGVGADSGDSKPNARVYGDSKIDKWECIEGCPVRALDEQTGTLTSGQVADGVMRNTTGGGGYHGNFGAVPLTGYGDSGGASRFFPQFEGQVPPEAPFFYTGKATKREATLDGQVPSSHPTRKPLSLMLWLVKLVTRPGGTVLDPFCGSGTTCVAAAELGMHFIGIEKDPEYHANAQKRVAIVHQKAQEEGTQRDAFDFAMDLD